MAIDKKTVNQKCLDCGEPVWQVFFCEGCYLVRKRNGHFSRKVKEKKWTLVKHTRNLKKQGLFPSKYNPDLILDLYADNWYN